MSRDRLIELAPPAEKAFLVAVDTGDDSGRSANDSLVELAALATTAGAEVVDAEWQNRRHVDPNWYIFAQHARTHEGRIQVELAQLEYQLPPLERRGSSVLRHGRSGAAAVLDWTGRRRSREMGIELALRAPRPSPTFSPWF